MKLCLSNLVRCLSLLTASGLLSLTGAHALAQATATKLTTAEEVLKRYVEVTGGEEKYKEIEGVSQEASMSLPLAGIEGKMEIKYSGQDQMLVEVDLGEAGKESSGISDGTGWSDSINTGTRLITGKELEQLKSQADMRQYYQPEAVYQEMELVGETEVDGEACYELKMTRKSGSVENEFYSVETGLKVKTKMTAETAMGAIPVEMFYKEYKKYNGIQHPTVMIQKLPNGMEMEIKTVQFEVNPKFAKGTFDMPEKVKKLVEKQNKKN